MLTGVPEPSTSAIFRALRSVDVDSELAHEAAEKSRRQAGENVIVVLGAKIDAQAARIEDLRRVIWRVKERSSPMGR